VTVAVAVWYFGFVTPNPNEDWIPKHARMPHVEVVGDKVHVSDVRNFTWRTPTDYTPGYADRVYDVSALSSMYYVLSPIFDLEPVAHVWVCFGFADGQHVAVSVEAGQRSQRDGARRGLRGRFLYAGRCLSSRIRWGPTTRHISAEVFRVRRSA